MSGKILEYEAKTIFQNGIRFGREEGREVSEAGHVSLEFWHVHLSCGRDGVGVAGFRA